MSIWFLISQRVTARFLLVSCLQGCNYICSQTGAGIYKRCRRMQTMLPCLHVFSRDLVRRISLPFVGDGTKDYSKFLICLVFPTGRTTIVFLLVRIHGSITLWAGTLVVPAASESSGISSDVDYYPSARIRIYIYFGVPNFYSYYKYL